MDNHPIAPASYFRLPTYRESHGRRFHPYPRYGPPSTVKPPAIDPTMTFERLAKMFDDADRPAESSSITKPAAPAPVPVPKSQPQSDCESCIWSPWTPSLPGQLRTLLKVEPVVKTQDK